MNLPRRFPVAALATLMLAFPLLTLTAGCDGNSDPLGLSSLGGRPTQPGNGTASVSWIPPLARVDGSPLTDLAGYRVWYGTSATALSKSVTLRNPGLTRYVVEGLTSGTWYFAVSAFDRQGLSSGLSGVASKRIP